MITNAYVIKKNRSDANQRSTFDMAAMQRHAMAHGHFVLKNRRAYSVAHMNDGIVLNVGAFANADEVNIATNDRIEPDRGFFTDVHIADDVSTFFNKRCGMD